MIFTISEETNIQECENIDNINIFCQYFIHSNNERQREITKCLKNNVKNKYITKIYLLNERIYTDEELDISSNKIIQININRRLQFKDVFEYINEQNIKGYNIIVNSDIFFKKNIVNIFKSDIHINKKMYALLRYEYNVLEPEKTFLFGPRGDSQDTWIIHSNYNIGEKECKIFNFEFGKPGCDNKIIYLFSLLGYNVINDPTFIKSYHIHETNIRNYSNKDLIKPPYEFIFPKDKFEMCKHTNNLEICYNPKYNHKISNHVLFNYINEKVENNKPFIIPFVSGIENQFAIYSMMSKMSEYKKHFSEIQKFFDSRKNDLKKYTGIKVSCNNSIKKYSKLYLEAFKNCEIYASWAPFDQFYNNHAYSHQLLDNTFNNKKTMHASVFDIFHYIYGIPWTFALKNKRILIISKFENYIQEKIKNRKDIYGIDLFPNCDILTLSSPELTDSEESNDFDIVLNDFKEKINNITDNYDIALVSCGGYGNLVCSYIYTSGKSAIHVGDVLQMYWGIIGKKWSDEIPDVIQLFLNNMWTQIK